MWEKGDATKLEIGKYFIRSEVTLSATVGLASTIELIYDTRVREKCHKSGCIKTCSQKGNKR